MNATAPEIAAGVVIPAAGSGQRLGGPRKQFRLLDGKPLLVQTASIFQNHSAISAIVVAVPKGDRKLVESLCSDYGLDKVSGVVIGGKTRQASIRKGLEALREDLSIVITHDAVRPFITAREVSRLIAAVRRTGAAALAAPVSDTIVRSEAGGAGKAVSRKDLFRMLTPQGFRREVLLRGHEMASDSASIYTDEATLVKASGHDVALVEGNPLNIKITTPSDWEFAEWLWPVWKTK